ncbi:MAG: four helix bundle protein [Pirellulales bacterium]
MRRQDLNDRTREFALRIIRLVSSLPKDRVADVVGRQILRSGTSIGANYREATRATTKRHFASILATALREADETLYWLELVRDAKLVRVELLRNLISECDQLVAILASSVKTAANRNKRRDSDS